MRLADARCKLTVTNDGVTDIASRNAMWSAATDLVNRCVSRGKWGIRRDLGRSRILCSVWNKTIANTNDDRPGPSPYRFNLSSRLKRGKEAVSLEMLQHCIEKTRRCQIWVLQVDQHPHIQKNPPSSIKSNRFPRTGTIEKEKIIETRLLLL